MFQEAAPIQTCLIKGMKAICDMYPEFQEIAQPVFSFAMSESTEKTLKDGVLSLETAKSSSYRMMQFMAVMVQWHLCKRATFETDIKLWLNVEKVCVL